MNPEHSIGEGAKAEPYAAPEKQVTGAHPSPADNLLESVKAWTHRIESRLKDRSFVDPLVLLAALLLCTTMAFTRLPDGQISDEGFHWEQFERYFSGNYETVASITMLPAYHLTVYGLSELFSLKELPQVRYVSFALSILALLFFFLIARQYHDKATSYPVSLQFFLSPLFFPFFFLIYTDIPAMTVVLAALWLAMSGRYQLAALIAGLSVVFRQTNFIWLLMAWTLSLAHLGFFTLSHANAAAAIRKWSACLWRTSLFPVCCLLFAAFIYFNGGIAVGDSGSHQVGLYPTQVFLLLFTLFLLFIPLHIANFRRIAGLLKSEPLWLFAGTILFGVYIFTFRADHGYNVQESEYFLRNMFLALIRDSFIAKTLTFIPIIIAFYSIAVTPMRRHSYYWLYPFAIAAVLPMWLIEPRYYIIPVALFMLLRKPLDRRFEYMQAAWYVPFAVYVFDGVYQYRFFP